MFSGNASGRKIYVPTSDDDSIINAYKSAAYWNSYAADFIASIPINEIWYTSSDGNIVTPSAKADFGAKIVSNTYKYGKGVLTFDAPITSIGAETFINCEKLSSVILPEGVTSIDEKAFYNCSELVAITLPASVKTIGTDALDVCNKLTSLRGPLASEDGRCVIIGSELVVFAHSGLTTYTIPAGVTKIGFYVFDNCDALTNVTIPDSVIIIDSGAFKSCEALTSIVIPEMVTHIGSDAFAGCKSLKTASIGESVAVIARGAFYNCTSLKEVYCKPTTPPTGDTNMFSNNASGRKIYVPASDDDSIINAYKAKQYWSSYTSYIEEYDFSAEQ